MSWRQTRICNCIQCRQDCDLYSLLTQRDQVLATEHQWAGPMGRKRLLVDVLLWRRVYANVCAPVKDLLCANLIFHVMAPLTENIVMEYWKQHKHSFSESQHCGLSHPISCGSYRTVWIDECMYDQQTRVIQHYNITTRVQEWAEDLQYSK